MFRLTPFNRSVVRRSDSEHTLSDFVDDFFGDDFFPTRSLRHDTFKVDVKESDDAFVIEADMPGIKKEDIRIDYHEGLMSISIELDETKEDNQESYIHRERKRCSMTRNLNLGDLDYENIEAGLADGILTIKAPKSEVIENKKRIEIK